MEDADDLGVLTIRDDALIFKGDGSDLVLVKEDIAAVEYRNVGFRVFWSSGQQPIITLKEEISGVTGLKLHPRMAKTWFQYRPIQKRFLREMKAFLGPRPKNNA